MRANEAAIATRRAVSRRVVEEGERSAGENERSLAKESIVVHASEELTLTRAYQFPVKRNVDTSNHDMRLP